MRNPFDGMGREESLKTARANAQQRALEQRMLVMNTIDEGAFLDVNPQSAAWRKVYGANTSPARVAPFTIDSNVKFNTTLNSIDCTTLGVKPAGSEKGISTIGMFAVPPAGNPFNVDFGAYKALNPEIVIAEFPLGVDDDIAFLKPRFPQGEIEFATLFSGYIRFRYESGGPATAGNSGYMNNGFMRVKVVDPMQKTTMVLLEKSLAEFNGASEAVSTPGSPRIGNDLKRAVYPNFQGSLPGEIITPGSSLQITVNNLFEDSIVELDAGTKVDLTASATAAVIDGKASKLYIDTKRLGYTTQW